MHNRPAVLSFLLLLGACASPGQDEQAMLAELAVEHEAQISFFQTEQAAFRARTKTPSTREFPGLGTLVIHQAALVGRPGKAWLRVQFTFVNTSSAGFAGVAIKLYLSDPATGERWSETLAIQDPLSVRTTKESSYTSSIRTPTRGVEFRPGWTWELVLEPATGAS